MAGLDLDMPAALATAREMGATGWGAAEMLIAMRMGLAAASVAPPPRPQASATPESAAKALPAAMLARIARGCVRTACHCRTSGTRCYLVPSGRRAVATSAAKPTKPEVCAGQLRVRESHINGYSS